MKTVKINTYKFEELSEGAKERAIQDYRQDGFDYDWWNFVYEDAKTVAGLMGIEIENIYFSGFWSQGDGACFEGDYAYKKGSVKAVKEYAPLDEELRRIAYGLYDVQRRCFYRLTARVEQSGHYVHEMCTDIQVYENVYGNWAGGDAEAGVTEFLRDFMRWIYRQLEREYDWLSSDETISETLIVNEYDFTEDGKFY